ncbi:MAG: efflux transporter outer membrane subunit [Hyphomicrobiales bacterium]|nr:efflux transporter outer membrane subunit [Hyphomicrobiales bacterium]
MPKPQSTRVRASFAVAATLGLAGCATLGPLPVAGVPVPSRFSDGAKAAAAPPIDWPRLFGSPELTALSARAQADNFDVAAAAARLEQARATAVSAAAPLQPGLSGSAGASWAHSPGTNSQDAPPFASHEAYQFNLGLTASYQVDLWGKNRLAALAASDQVVASAYDLATVRLSTQAALVTAYLTLVSAQDRIAIARADVRVASRVLDAIKGRLDVGTATALDVAQQTVVVAQQRAALPPLELSARQQKAAIAVLLGVPPESLRVRGGGLMRLRFPRTPPGLPSQTLERRPDVASAEAALAAAHANVGVARAALYPSVSLTGSGGLESKTLANLLRPDALFANLASSLTQPIWDGGNLRAELALQEGKRAELLANYRKAIVSAFSDVENALAAVEADSRHERLQADAVKAAREAESITEQRLREGTIDVVTLLAAQTSYFQAQDTLAQVRLEKFLAAESLFQALGGGFAERSDVAAAPTNGATPGATP